MRILHVHAGNLWGGTERVVETLAKERGACPALDSKFVLCFEGKLSERLRQFGVDPDMIGAVRFSRPDLLVRARRRLALILKRGQHDVVVTQSVWSHAVFAPVVRRHRLPLALWIHDLLSGHHWVEKLAQRWQPDLLICNSHHTEAAARTVFPSVAAEIIHGPLSLQNGWIPRSNRAAASAVPGSPAALTLPGLPDLPDRSGRAGPVVIAHVGRMVSLKGHRILIDALARLPLEPSWVCWFVGGPQTDEEAEYERGLREHVNRLNLEGRVQFLGATDDVMAILREAQIYCQPNDRPEAFGLSFVEALHAGVPVVTTAIGGAREIVTDACGRLVPRGDVEALAATLRSLIEDPAARRTLGRNGPARAWMLCNPEARLDQLRVVLGRVALEAAA